MTPYLLGGAGCNQALIGMSRFVHAVILNTDNGVIATYAPLVITNGTMPEVPPTPVNFTVNNHIVGIWLGSNSNTLTLINAVGIMNGNCQFGTPGSAFGQFAFCNVQNFWKAIELVRAQGLLAVPPIGVAVDGQPCPTVRDYFVIDMDPDDGVPTEYIVTAAGNVIQNTVNNMRLMASMLANDGDHRLVSVFVNVAAGCQGWLVPDLTDPGVKRPALPMNVLQAVYFQGLPVEYLPNNDPMTTTNNNPDLAKLNLYRLGIYQPQISNLQSADPALWCMNYANVAIPRFKTLMVQLQNTMGPMAGTTLFGFMKARGTTTWGMIGCANLIGLPDPFANL